MKKLFFISLILFAQSWAELILQKVAQDAIKQEKEAQSDIIQQQMSFLNNNIKSYQPMYHIPYKPNNFFSMQGAYNSQWDIPQIVKQTIPFNPAYAYFCNNVYINDGGFYGLPSSETPIPVDIPFITLTSKNQKNITSNASVGTQGLLITRTKLPEGKTHETMTSDDYNQLNKNQFELVAYFFPAVSNKNNSSITITDSIGVYYVSPSTTETFNDLANQLCDQLCIEKYSGGQTINQWVKSGDEEVEKTTASDYIEGTVDMIKHSEYNQDTKSCLCRYYNTDSGRYHDYKTLNNISIEESPQHK